MRNPIFRIMSIESMVNSNNNNLNNNNNNNLNNNNNNNLNNNNNNLLNNLNNNNILNNNNLNNMNINNMAQMMMQPPNPMNQFQPMFINLPNNNLNIINNNALQEQDKEKIELSPDDIYNKNEVENMIELLKCPICLNILNSPVQCNKCNNCFCKLCIDYYKDSKTKCPFRCENPLYMENKFVKNVLSILKFKCRNGCDKIIKYDELEKHYEEECEKIDYKAKYKALLKKYKELKKEYDKVKPRINMNNNMELGMMNNMAMNNMNILNNLNTINNANMNWMLRNNFNNNNISDSDSD